MAKADSCAVLRVAAMTRPEIVQCSSARAHLSLTMVLLLGLVAGSCATMLVQQDHEYTCSWLEVAAPPEVVATAVRQHGLGRRAQCGSVGEYRLARVAYAIELWNGDSSDAVLFARARASSGARLSIESDDFSPVNAELMRITRPGSRAAEFDYQLRIAPASGNSALRTYPVRVRLTIRDRAGTLLGTEEVLLTERRGRYIERDSV